MPLLFVEAEKDETISNDHIRAMYEKAKKAGKQNEYVTVGGKFSDHTVVTVDPVMGSQVMKSIIKFFNRLVEEKEQKLSESSFSF